MEEQKPKTRVRRRGNGDGSISQRADGYWVGQVTLGIDPRTCKQIRKSVVRKSRQDVLNEIKKMHTSQQQGTLIKADKITTLEQWLNQWLEGYKKVSLKATTYSNYKAAINWITPNLGAYKLQKLDHTAIQAFIHTMLNKNLSPRTVNDCISLLKNALNYAVKHKLIESNPCDLVERPKIPKTEKKIWSSIQLQKFKEEIKDYYLEAAMYLLMHGMRRGEILGLCCENLHLNEGFISIRNNLVITSQGVRLEPTPKTSASTRDIPLTKETIELLRRHVGNRKTGLVFTTSEGNYIHPRSFQRSFDMLLKRARLPKIRLHDMRHSTASLLLTNGTDLRSVSDILGHASTRVTTDIYLHSTMAHKRQAVGMLNDLLTKEA